MPLLEGEIGSSELGAIVVRQAPLGLELPDIDLLGETASFRIDAEVYGQSLEIVAFANPQASACYCRVWVRDLRAASISKRRACS